MLDRNKVIGLLLKVSPLVDWDRPGVDLDEAFKIAVVNPLYKSLHKGWVGVHFTKVNGEDRRLVCTLNEKYLPEKPAKDDVAPKHARNPDVAVVWDRDEQAWRSFRLDSIIDAWELVPVI